MLIVTMLTALLCNGEGVKCKVDDSYVWEASSYTEAVQDWGTCLQWREAFQATGKYKSVECDQFDPNAKVVL